MSSRVLMLAELRQFAVIQAGKSAASHRPPTRSPRQTGASSMSKRLKTWIQLGEGRARHLESEHPERFLWRPGMTRIRSPGLLPPHPTLQLRSGSGRWTKVVSRPKEPRPSASTRRRRQSSRMSGLDSRATYSARVFSSTAALTFIMTSRMRFQVAGFWRVLLGNMQPSQQMCRM